MPGEEVDAARFELAPEAEAGRGAGVLGPGDELASGAAVALGDGTGAAEVRREGGLAVAGHLVGCHAGVPCDAFIGPPKATVADEVVEGERVRVGHCGGPLAVCHHWIGAD